MHSKTTVHDSYEMSTSHTLKAEHCTSSTSTMAGANFVSDLIDAINAANNIELQKVYSLLEQLTAVARQQQADINLLKQYRAEAVRGRAEIQCLRMVNDAAHLGGGSAMRNSDRPANFRFPRMRLPARRPPYLGNLRPNNIVITPNDDEPIFQLRRRVAPTATVTAAASDGHDQTVPNERE